MSKINFRSHFWPFQIDMQLNLFWKFWTKWLPSAILDVRNSLSIAFLAIVDQYRILIFFEIFDKMAGGGHFWCSKITFDGISGHFRSIDHFGWLKITFDRISGHFRSIRNFFFWIFQKSANTIYSLVPKCIYIKLYSASSRYEHCSNHSLNVFCKCFFFKWPLVAILDVQRLLLTISDQYHNFYFCEFLAPLCHLAAELFKCRLVRRRRCRRRRRRRRQL